MPKGLEGFQKGNRVGVRFQKGGVAWNKGKKILSEQIPWNKGKKLPPRSKEHSEKFSGANQWNWKGGITPLVMKIRNCFKYRQWRSDVFTRDNFICILCGKRGGELNADHYPKSFSGIMKEYNIKTFEEALNCEELWNINNGRTLCIFCHRKTETYSRPKVK